MKKKKYQFTEEQKRKAVDEYVAGHRRAEDIAKELGIPQGYLYKWRVQLSERGKNARVDELEGKGMSREVAQMFEMKQAEIDAYRAALAQQIVINDLLKKLPASMISQRESELNGLLAITRKLARSKGPVK